MAATDISRIVNGSTRAKLTQFDLSTIFLPVPPVIEQQTIADHLDAETAKIDQAIEKKRTQLALLKQQRQSLIFEYVTGKRRVSEVA